MTGRTAAPVAWLTNRVPVTSAGLIGLSEIPENKFAKSGKTS